MTYVWAESGRTYSSADLALALSMWQAVSDRLDRLTTVWDSGRVTSAASTNVPYAGPALDAAVRHRDLLVAGLDVGVPPVLTLAVAFVVAARALDGSFAHYGVIENSHHQHILDLSLAPAALAPALVEQAVADQPARRVDGVGGGLPGHEPAHHVTADGCGRDDPAHRVVARGGEDQRAHRVHDQDPSR